MNWLQRHWDARAALNFMCGGAGAGLIVAVAVLGIGSPYAPLAGLALVAAGLFSVWLEIGRKLRAINVFFNPFTSWMSRESFAAALLFLLGFAYLLFHDQALLYGTAIAAAAFLFCQAQLIRAAKGIPAWRVRETLPLIVLTGLSEGFGLALIFDSGAWAFSLFALATLARAMAWRRHAQAVQRPALANAGRSLLWLGTVAALALAAAAYFVPAAAPLAGLAALAGGWHYKLALITRAAFNQGFSLPRMPVRGAR